MQNTIHYDYIVRRLRCFFQEQKGFIEVPSQSRLSILAACEDPKTIAQFQLTGVGYPLPQTGQMWLERELLDNPHHKGVFCISTSYRDEPNIIEGRHQRVFPMFEFEAPGDITALKKLEQELLLFLGFEFPVSIVYEDICKKYHVSYLEAEQEEMLYNDFGSSIILEQFPRRSHPFWNMKHSHDDLYHKVDVILYGMETIGSAERSTNVDEMREQFLSVSDGGYAGLLFKTFGRDRVLRELDEYLALNFIQRFGGGIGLTRLEHALQQADLFNKNEIPAYRSSPSARMTL